MISKEIFYWMVSLSGLVIALFMYWNVVREYNQTKLKPFTWSAAFNLFLLGIGLSLFNRFLSAALETVADPLNWGIRILFVLVLSLYAFVIFREARVA